jgi:polysaccharide pyruvyl transferase WcaK-like protein
VRATGQTHAVIAGSLGKGNLGDETLLQTFLGRHWPDYDAMSVVVDGARAAPGPEVQVVPVPTFALGRRFWRGFAERRRAARSIVDHASQATRELVWLGGLLGPDEPHTRRRLHELRWALGFCRRPVYYFGDAADGLAAAPSAAPLVRLLDESEAFVAVRSAEAAAALTDAGLRAPIRSGVDPVLYDRAAQRPPPFARRQPPTETVVIVPCVYHRARWLDAWLAAARAAVRYRLTLCWVSFSDDEDLALCHELADAVRREHPEHPQEVGPSHVAETHIARAACCVATRYHAAIFALTEGVPVIGIAYDVKIARLLRLLEMDEFVVDEPDAEGSQIADQVRRAAGGAWAPDYARLSGMLTDHTRTLETLTGAGGAR